MSKPNTNTKPKSFAVKAMRDAKRWIIWRWGKPNNDGKRKKIPAEGWTQPANWMDYTTARATAQTSEQLGFVLGDGWAGIDVDGAWDEAGEHRPHSRAVWEACKGAYVERSPRGAGYKVFLQIDPAVRDSATEELPGDHIGTEIYATTGRWFAVTGEVLPGCGRDTANPKAVASFPSLLADLKGRVAQRVRGQADELADPAFGAIRAHAPALETALRDALAMLPADDRDTWVRYGHAIRAMGWDDDDAFALWHQWSSKSDKYEGEESCRRTWDGLTPRGEVSVASVFAAAKQAATMQSAGASCVARKVFNGREFAEMEEQEVYEPVPGMLAPGLTLIMARQKLGKTFLAQQLSVGLSLGDRKFLGVRIARPHRVKCYLMEEGGEPDVQRKRFREMGYVDDFAGPLCSPHAENLVLEFGRLPPMDKGGLAILAADLEQYDVVIVDSVTAVDHGERKHRDVFKAQHHEMTALQDVARKARKCLVMLSHTRKGSDTRSSPHDITDSTSGKLAGVDCYWALQSDKDDESRVRLTVVGRHKSVPPMAIARGNNNEWQKIADWDQIAPSKKAESAATIEQEILKVLPLKVLGPPMPTREVVASLGHRSSKAVEAKLSQMAEDGLIERSAEKARGRVGHPGSAWTALD